MRPSSCKISKGNRRRPTELRISPESQKALKARMESPEGQELLDELARCFVQAAVERLLKEQTIADVAQSSESI
jgi:hypothetical protein